MQKAEVELTNRHYSKQRFSHCPKPSRWTVWVTYQRAEEPHGLLLYREKAHP
jgi:hypothetical protein